MKLIRVRIENVKRGSMIPGWGGVAIADTLSADRNGIPFWYDTDELLHAWKRDGFASIYVPTVRTNAFGRSQSGVCHALTHNNQGVCPGARQAELAVWESGIALAYVTCDRCRRMYNLACTPKKEGDRAA